jgi:hypothetical protein
MMSEKELALEAGLGKYVGEEAGVGQTDEFNEDVELLHTALINEKVGFVWTVCMSTDALAVTASRTRAQAGAAMPAEHIVRTISSRGIGQR